MMHGRTQFKINWLVCGLCYRIR